MRIPVLTILLGILLQTASAQSLDNRFTTYLLFEGDAMEAVELYTSLFVQADSEEQVDQWFEALSKGGQVLMPLASYPFSDRFAWVNDRFGVSWQLSLANED